MLLTKSTTYRRLRAIGAARPVRVAVTGHRELGDPATVMFVSRAFDALLARLQRACPAGVVALSGLCEGADTLFAEAALDRGISLEVCIAATQVVRNFPPGPERDRHLMLRAFSTSIHQLPFVECSNESYMVLGRWLVDSCDLLIAAWNGLPAAALGGTGDVVEYARSVGRPGVHIHTLRRAVDCIEPVAP